MSRGISDTTPVQPEETEGQFGDGPSNDDIMDFMDQVALLVRDLDTRVSTLERLLSFQFKDGK